MLQEVLVPIGSIVDIENHKEEVARYLIVVLRQYNPNSGKSWDYIAVPFPDGYTMNCKTEHPYDNNNFYFFNHTEIIKVIQRQRDIINEF